jgi:hypothetical protein
VPSQGALFLERHGPGSDDGLTDKKQLMTRRTLPLLGLLIALAAPAEAALLFNTNANWNLFKGRSEASTPDTAAWRKLLFNDSTWTNSRRRSGMTYWTVQHASGTRYGHADKQLHLHFPAPHLRADQSGGHFACGSALFVMTVSSCGSTGWRLNRYNVPAGNLRLQRRPPRWR